jgi:hypothetical protein
LTEAGEVVDLEGAGVDVAQHEVAGVSGAMLLTPYRPYKKLTAVSSALSRDCSI